MDSRRVGASAEPFLALLAVPQRLDQLPRIAFVRRVEQAARDGAGPQALPSLEHPDLAQARPALLFRIGRTCHFVPARATVARTPQLGAEVAEIQGAPQNFSVLKNCRNGLSGEVVLGDLSLAHLEQALARPH